MILSYILEHQALKTHWKVQYVIHITGSGKKKTRGKWKTLCKICPCVPELILHLDLIIPKRIRSISVHACVTRQSLGDIWVIFRSPRVTYYTRNMFGFNVNYSYLYLFKI